MSRMLFAVVLALLTGPGVSKPAIVCQADAGNTHALAAAEVQRYIYQCSDTLLPIAGQLPAEGDAIVLRIDDQLKHQQYALNTSVEDDRKVLRITGGSEVAVLYGAYHFAEKLGVRFHLHGDVIPDDKNAFALPQLDENHEPLFELRGVNPWGSHSEGMDLWNTDDYIQVFGQLAKLRMNFLGIHSYPENPEPRCQYDSEPTVWIGPPGDFDGQGRVSRSFSASYFNTLRDGQWGYIPRPTGEYRFGASLLFERDDWGPEVMLGQCPVPTTPEGCNAVFNRTGQMFDEAFSVARKLGVKTCIGTESPLTIPAAVKERLLKQHKQAGQRVFDVKLQDRLVAEKLDIYEKAGHMTALEIHADSVQVNDGWLHLDMQPVKGQPCIAAIAIEGDHFKRKLNCGGMAYRDYQADPPRTKTFNWGPKDTAYEQRGLPCDDFYLDWAIHKFGQTAGPRIAALFTRLDGRVPLVSSFDCGAGALWPDDRTWELVEKEVDPFTACGTWCFYGHAAAGRSAADRVIRQSHCGRWPGTDLARHRAEDQSDGGGNAVCP